MHVLESPRVDEGAKNIVVVEGTRHGQSFVRSLLAGMRVGRVRTFEDGESALNEMRIDPPALVITDWEVRARGGYWLVANMRRAEMDPLCFVPVLALTSEISWSMLDIALEVGVNAVALKPISATAFKRQVDVLVGTKVPFVEQDGVYVPAATLEVLETKMRAGESRAARAYRERVRAALVGVSEVATAEEPTPQETPVSQRPRMLADPPGWEGWHAA